MANIDFPSTPTVGQRYTFAGITYVFTAQGVWNPGISIVTQVVPQGRLTLQSGVPVMTTTSIGHTSIFYTPYAGNKVPIWNGNSLASMAVISCLPELIAQTTDATKNPSPLGINKLNDWFIWNDAGTVRLTHGPDWSSNTARLDALARVEGILLNTVSITNGPAAPGAATAQRSAGTYVGTTYSNASAQLDWIYAAVGVPPTAGFFGIWNMYNRVQVGSMIGDGSASWSYSSDVIREIRGNTTAKFHYVTGMQEDSISAAAFVSATASAGGVLITGVGFDSNTQYSGAVGSIPNYNVWGYAAGRYSSAAMGKHFFAHCESVNAPGYPQTVLGSSVGTGTTGFGGGTLTGMFFDGRF